MLTEKANAENQQKQELANRLQKQSRAMFVCFIVGLSYHSYFVHPEFGTIIKYRTLCVGSQIWTINVIVPLTNIAFSIFLWAFWPKQEKKRKVHIVLDKVDNNEEEKKAVSSISSIESEGKWKTEATNVIGLGEVLLRQSREVYCLTFELDAFFGILFF